MKEETKEIDTKPKEVNLNIIDEAHIIESKWIRKGEELDIRVSKSNVISFERFKECVKD